MKFLDKKEQVLELKMTQYGKSLLSRGLFRPTYYAFFDDDVIYDTQYMSSGSSDALESSTNASQRIRNMPRPETQHNHAGIETNITKMQEPKWTETVYLNTVMGNFTELTLEEKLQNLSKPLPAIDSYYSLGLPMGTSEYSSKNAPAWDLELRQGEISGSVLDYTGSSGLLKIPQIEVRATYDAHRKQFVATNGEQPQDVSDNITIFSDNSYIEIESDHILIELGEYNSLFENQNFDIEVYEIVEENQVLASEVTTKETLKPLYFIDGKKVVNEVYYSEDMEKKIDITDSNVEYYFDIRVDDEIDDSVGIEQTAGLYNTPENNKEPCED
jgi:hypothetical protein